MKFSGNKNKIAKNVFWAMLGKVINMTATLFVGILVARYLGPENYGLMNYVISYVTLFSILATFGLDHIEIRELSKKPGNRDFILGTSFRLRCLFATIANIVIVFTLWINKTDMFTSIMVMMYSLSLYTGTFNVIRNYFTSIIKNEYVVKTEIMRTILGSFIKIVLLWFKSPVEYFVAATLFDTFLVSSGYVMSYHKLVGKVSCWKYDKELAPFLIKESFPLLLSGAAVVIYQRIDQVMIGNMIDHEAVGYFATAGKFVNLILFLPTVLTQTVTPLVIKAKQSGNQKEYEMKQKQMVSIVTWIAIMLATIVSIFSYWLIRYTFGVQYLAAVPVLQIMAWKTLGMALSSSAGQVIIMEGIQKWAVVKNLLGCLCCVVFNYLLLPTYGIVGCAWVTILTTLIAGFWGNLLIPAYHHIFRLQFYALTKGWQEIRYFKQIIKK